MLYLFSFKKKKLLFHTHTAVHCLYSLLCCNKITTKFKKKINLHESCFQNWNFISPLPNQTTPNHQHHPVYIHYAFKIKLYKYTVYKWKKKISLLYQYRLSNPLKNCPRSNGNSKHVVLAMLFRFMVFSFLKFSTQL